MNRERDRSDNEMGNYISISANGFSLEHIRQRSLSREVLTAIIVKQYIAL